MIVVFDSGIWVSAMEFGGTPLEAVVRAIAQDRFAVCDQIEEEVVRVLTSKFGWEDERVHVDLAFIGRRPCVWRSKGPLPASAAIPKTNRFSNAPNAKAQCIVSGDHDLLSLTSYRGIRIMTARDYVEPI